MLSAEQPTGSFHAFSALGQHSISLPDNVLSIKHITLFISLDLLIY